MKIFILTISFLLSINSLFSSCVIFCNAKYTYKVYHKATPPAYYEGPTIGRVPIFGTERKAYYSTEVSEMYSLNITFASGYEFNEVLNEIKYNPSDIIAIVKWNNGGSSIIVLDNFYTTMNYVNEQEIIFENSTKKRIYQLNGVDLDGRIWEINIP